MNVAKRSSLVQLNSPEKESYRSRSILKNAKLMGQMNNESSLLASTKMTSHKQDGNSLSATIQTDQLKEGIESALSSAQHMMQDQDLATRNLDTSLNQGKISDPPSRSGIPLLPMQKLFNSAEYDVTNVDESINHKNEQKFNSTLVNPSNLSINQVTINDPYA